MEIREMGDNGHILMGILSVKKHKDVCQDAALEMMNL